MRKRKQTNYPYAAIIADAQAAAHTLPTGLDDMTLAEAAGAAWFAWVQQITTIPPNGHTLYHIALLREYLTMQGQQMRLMEAA